MNEARLRQIFKNYIEKFDYLNEPDPGPNEKYKWEIAYDFRSRMDDIVLSSAENMYEPMKKLMTDASNLLLNRWELPGAALYEYCDANRAPEKVRDLLAALFADDGGDLGKRQKKIDAFIAGCGRLKEQYFPGSFKYEMTQRAAMVLLGLYDPDHNYLYKATQANEFADCVEFYDEWGAGTNFRLSVYYRMCDQLADYIEKDAELLAAHRKRYIDPVKPLYEDKELHILAFDIIYCSTVYDLMADIPYTHISGKEKQQYRKKQEEAEGTAEELDEAEKALAIFLEAAEYYKPYLSEGARVRHRVFGPGTVKTYTEAPDWSRIHVRFDSGREAAFLAENAAASGFLTFEAPDLAERNEKYKKAVESGKDALEKKVRALEEKLSGLRDYLL